MRLSTLLQQCLWLPLLAAVTAQTEAPTASPTATMSPTATPWGGCVDPNNKDALVTIGKKTTICLVLANGPDWSVELRTYMRLHFQPIADEYSRFHVPESFNQLLGGDGNDKLNNIFGGKNITVHAASQTSVSFQKVYFNGNANGKVFPHLTAIVNVEDGVVKGITWDDACVFCGKKECEANTYDFQGHLGSKKEFKQPVGGCFKFREDCTSTECDIIMYVVWTGTDSNGNAFQSSASRFSEFPAQELADRFSQSVPF